MMLIMKGGGRLCERRINIYNHGISVLRIIRAATTPQTYIMPFTYVTTCSFHYMCEADISAQGLHKNGNVTRVMINCMCSHISPQVLERKQVNGVVLNAKPGL